MAFNANIPQPTDRLSTSQQDLLNNNSALNTVFGIDHYPFDNATANSGFHNVVTQPLIVGSNHPTTTTNPKIYAMQDTSNIGVLQYSRGPSNSWPTPITKRQSPSTAISINGGATSNVIDFTGANLIIGTLYIANASTTNASNVKNGVAQFTYHLVETGSVPSFDINYSGTSTLSVISSGKILQIKNTTGSVINAIYWTLELHRIKT